MWRKLRKIFFWLIGIFTGLILVLVFVVWLMQDKIKAYAIDYLNQHLKSDLKVDKIDVTFISTFPNVSLHFKNALILDPEGLQSYRDTLFSAKDLYLKFGLWDVIAGNYEAKSLDLYNAHLRVFINEKGQENYDILKPQPPSTEKKEKKEFKLDLSKVRFYHTRLTYHNATGNQQYKFKTKELLFEGKFSDTQYDLRTSGDLHIIQLRNKNLVLFKNQDSDIDLVLNIDKNTHTYSFTRGDWQIGKMLLGIKGNLNHQDEGTLCDLKVFGKNISLVSVMQLLPDKARKSIDRYKSMGMLDLDAGIKGLMSKTKAPDVNVTFSIDNGILIERKSDISLHNIDMKGTYTNRNKLGVDELTINKMDGRFKDGTFALHGKLTDFEKPHFIFEVAGHFSLSTLHDFIDPEAVKDMRGDLDVDSKFDFILLRTDDLLLTNTVVNQASGTVKFSNATVLISENGNPITELNGQLNLTDNDALVDGLNGKIGSTDFSINGAIRNFTPYFLTGNQNLSVVGAFHSDYCNIVDLLTRKKTTPEQVGEMASGGKFTQYTFPEKINFNVDLHISKLDWLPFTASNIRGNFKLIDQQLSASGLNIDLAGGTCSGDVLIDGGSGNGFAAKAHTQVQNVQLPKLLALFDNFGQDLLTPDNARGVLTATTDCYFPISASLEIPEEKVMATSSISIKKGELIELKQLKQVAGFMRTDKKLKLFLSKDADDFGQRVRDLRFDDLTNDLSFKDGILTIPKMEISSSALKINFSGTHSLSSDIDYHFNFRFNELKSRQSETEFGEIRDDGTGIRMYIHMFGTMSKPKYEWDKGERKADRQEQREQEKANLKSMLKEEFGFFKKDTTVKEQKANQDDVKFIMDWDEKNTETPENKTQSEKDNKRLKKLKKKLGIDENGNKDVNFDIEQE